MGLLILLLGAKVLSTSPTDTFDPASRDPALLAPGVAEANAQRLAIAAHFTDDFLKRCAESIAAHYRSYAKAGTADTSKDLQGDERRNCSLVEFEYFQKRNRLAADLLEETLPDGRPNQEQWLRSQDELATFRFERQYGPAAIEALEGHAEEFHAARCVPSCEGLALPALRPTPGVWPRQRLLAGIKAYIDHLATPEIFRKYQELRHRVVLDRRLRGPVEGSEKLQDYERERAVKERRERVQAEHAAAVGLTMTEVLLMERLLEIHAKQATEGYRAKMFPESRWEAYRQRISPAAFAFFEEKSLTGS